MECIMGASPDQILHRYMDLSKMLDMLINQQLFFSKIAAFPDKLEGSISEIDFMAAGDWGEMLDVAMNLSLPPVSETPDERVERKRKEADALEKIKHKKYSTVFGEFEAETTEGRLDLRTLVNKQKEWLYASCWHVERSESESIAMWKIYGGTNLGVCVISTVADVLGSLKLPPGYDICASLVKYLSPSDSLTMALGDDKHDLAHYSWKHHYYWPEQELRFIGYNNDVDIFAGGNPALGLPLDIDLHRLIREIRISPESPTWFYSVLEKLVNQNLGLGIPIKKSGMYGLIG